MFMNFSCTYCKVNFPDMTAYNQHLPVCLLKHELAEVTKSMPNRFQTNVRKVVYDFLVARDGEHCLHCNRPACRDGPPLEIDHADDDPLNWDPANLHLLCKTCNLGFRSLSREQHLEIISRDSAKNVCVCERSRGNLSTELSKHLVDYTRGSPEMQANRYYEVRFRQWLLEELDKAGFMVQKDVVNSGAEYVGCSPISAERYLAKLTSSMGVLELKKSELNQTIVCRRQMVEEIK